MDTTRQLLETLERLQEANPTWRFGQLVANIALFARGPAKSSVYDVEDEELLRAAQEYLAQAKAAPREQVAA